MQELLNKVNETRNAYSRIIAELRAMGMSEAFIAEFIDSGKADDIADTLVKKGRKNG